MAKKDFAEIKLEVKKLVSDTTKVPEKDLKDNALFVEDLDIDSMMALELIASIEKKYRVIVPEEKITAIRNMQSVYDLLEELLKDKIA